MEKNTKKAFHYNICLPSIKLFLHTIDEKNHKINRVKKKKFFYYKQKNKIYISVTYTAIGMKKVG